MYGNKLSDLKSINSNKEIVYNSAIPQLNRNFNHNGNNSNNNLIHDQMQENLLPLHNQYLQDNLRGSNKIVPIFPQFQNHKINKPNLGIGVQNQKNERFMHDRVQNNQFTHKNTNIKSLSNDFAKNSLSQKILNSNSNIDIKYFESNSGLQTGTNNPETFKINEDYNNSLISNENLRNFNPISSNVEEKLDISHNKASTSTISINDFSGNGQSRKLCSACLCDLSAIEMELFNLGTKSYRNVDVLCQECKRCKSTYPAQFNEWVKARNEFLDLVEIERTAYSARLETTNSYPDPNVVVNCPNTNPMYGVCDWSGACGLLYSHLSDCQLQIAPCPYTKFGCKFLTLRKDMDEHLQSKSLIHLSLANDKIYELTDLINLVF